MRLLLTVCFLLAFAFGAANAWACTAAAPEGRVFPDFQKPVVGHLVTGFGTRRHPVLLYARMHTGVDYVAEAGTPVNASAAGTVVFAGEDGAYGNRVVIAHGSGTETAYAHLLRIDVQRGDCVAQGAIIGAVGATGLSERNQLHFEVLRDGRFIDPLAALARRQ